VRVRTFAPGRINLIGDHTDYTGGYVFPMAVHLGSTVEAVREGETVNLTSDHDARAAVVPLDVADPRSVDPPWARYVAGVVAEIRPRTGLRGRVSTTLPVGAGLSSSAALEVAVAVALGFAGPPLELARICRRAEQRASGVPCGIMDQLTSAAGRAGHALLIDCSSDSIRPIRTPEGIEVVAVHSGQTRDLTSSAYAERKAECDEAAKLIGPLRGATLADLAAIRNAPIRRRARHVITENARVLAFAEAWEGGDMKAAGDLMDGSHASLRQDFEVSSPALDDLVDRLRRIAGVFGARLTGAGFGGCAVALTEPGAVSVGWRLEAAGPAGLINGGPRGPVPRSVG
jgi:galactokinase